MSSLLDSCKDLDIPEFNFDDFGHEETVHTVEDVRRQRLLLFDSPENNEQQEVQYHGEKLSGKFSIADESSETLTSLLTILKSKIDLEAKRNIVNVVREDVLDGGMRAFRRKSFQEWAPLSVVFASEQGIDNGGPSREFLLLSSKSIRDLNIFEGDSNARMVALDYIALENGLYKTAGSMLAYSIVHGGPIPAFLSPILYDAISKGVDKTNPQIGDIVDYEARKQLQAIQESKDEEAFQHAADSMEDIISLAGCVSLATKYNNKESLVKNLCHFLALGRVYQCLEQFKTGLQTCEILQNMQKHPDFFQQVFVKSPDDPIVDATTFGAYFHIHESSWSLPGHHRRTMEEKTLAYWRDFLQDLEDDGKLGLLLRFVTGLEVMPPLGIDPQPTLTFGHADDLKGDHSANFLMANTCANILRIPVLGTYELFRKNGLSALEMVNVFTQE